MSTTNMFEGTKAEQKAAQKAHAQEVMREFAGRTFYTRTDYGKGETDYVRIFIAPASDKIEDITYYVARACELSMTDRGIKFGGGGYSKGLEAAEFACSAANDGRTLNQQQEWKEIH